MSATRSLKLSSCAFVRRWHSDCISKSNVPVHDVKASLIMDLSIWIPVTVILGLVTMGLMFAFVEACEKV
jgi:hypothetical protein